MGNRRGFEFQVLDDSVESTEESCRSISGFRLDLQVFYCMRTTVESSLELLRSIGVESYWRPILVFEVDIVLQGYRHSTVILGITLSIDVVSELLQISKVMDIEGTLDRKLSSYRAFILVGHSNLDIPACVRASF